MELETSRLRVVSLSRDDLLLRLHDHDKLERKLGLQPTPEPSYADASYDASAREPDAYLWHTFRQIVGEQHVHGPPDAQGVVEFGYMMRPGHRNRGFATESARALLTRALAQPGVTAVVAETDRDNVASQRVLQRLGFLVASPTATLMRGKRTNVTIKPQASGTPP